MPALVKAALAHVQFETIHPFLDGNGRLGRLLITFMLCMEGLLKEPLLYLSLYFKANRQDYSITCRLSEKKVIGKAGLHFFSKASLRQPHKQPKQRKPSLPCFMPIVRPLMESGQSTAGVLSVHQFLQRHPIAKTAQINKACKISLPTVLRALPMLESLGIVREVTGKDRNKVFAYQDYLATLNKGTKPIVRLS